MKATEAPFLKFLQGTNQFVVPIYQRTYNWRIKECEQLWDDIVRVATDDSVPAHFVGSIVYIERDIHQVTTVPQLLVIDGQQRLTTLTLMLSALARAIADAGDLAAMSQKKLENYYLFNSEETDSLRYKLLLGKGDRDTLAAIVDGRPAPVSPSLRVLQNYDFFVQRIKSSVLSHDVVLTGLQKLVIVDIALNRTYDNPQLIFESLNSTGLELSQADLVRNFVLMGLEPSEQNELYTDHWFPMEQGFGQAAYAVYFDRFMRDYLTVKTSRIPNIGEVYEDFKTYVRSAHMSVEPLVSEIHRYSQYFTALALERETDEDVRRAVADINALRVEVAYPFLLDLYERYRNELVDRSDFITILRLVESYVLRRVICGIPTNTLGKTFAGLVKEMHAENPLESVRASFLLKDSYRRFPDDEEFRREFVGKDIYNLRIRNYILRKLENHDRKEPVDVDAYTIEHVMPQNPDQPRPWRLELGPNWKEVQDRYLHTIGNLTLTGYNSELSDRPFAQKQSMKGGFRDSPIRLNSSLRELPAWNEEAIRARASDLATLALQVWQVPALSAAAVEKYRETPAEIGAEYTFEQYPYLAGPTLELFEQFRRRVTNFDSSVRVQLLKYYIAFKSDTNFVDVVPQKQGLRLSLNLTMDELDDPRGIAKDVTGRGHWGNGDAELLLSFETDLEYVLGLVYQALQKQNAAVLE